MIKLNPGNPLSIRYKLTRFFCFLILTPFVRKVTGLDNFPRNNTFILASNHTSHIDWVILNMYLSRTLKKYIHFLATTKYYSNPFYKFLVETTQCIMVKEGEAAKSMFLALRTLQSGEIVGVFPEGTRSPDGTIKKARTGVAALALTAKVPVVPAGLIDTSKVLPRGAAFLRPARCKVNIGKPLEFKKYYKEHDEALKQRDREKVLELEKKVTQDIMREIAQLSNQEHPY